MGRKNRCGYAILIGLVLILGIGSANVGADHVQVKDNTVCLVQDCGGSSDGPDISCSGDADEGFTTCTEDQFGDIEVEEAHIKYCGTGDDGDDDGDIDSTTAEIQLKATDGGWQEILFEQTYQDGIDLDADNEDNNNNDCGYWSETDNNGIDKLSGAATDGSGDGCSVDGPHGWWLVGLDKASD